MLTEDDILSFQHAAIDYGLNVANAALFMGLGTGKTMCAQTIVATEMMTGSITKTLVIAPLLVANQGWHTEAKKWEHLQHLRFSIVTGSLKQRESALAVDADIYVTNAENTKWLIEHHVDFNKRWPFDMIIFDESQMFKDASSQRFKYISGNILAKYGMRQGIRTLLRKSKIDRSLLLSATPMTRGVEGLWSQMYLLDHGDRLGRHISNFRGRYMQADQYVRHKWHARPDALEQILGRIKDICLVIRTEDYLDLPAITYRERVVTMPESAQRRYDKLKAEFLLRLRKAGGEIDEITAANVAVLGAKLQQICNGALYESTDPTDAFNTSLKDRPFHYLHSAKLDALLEIVNTATTPLIVCYWFKSDLKRIKEYIPSAVVMDKEGSQLADWNDGKIPVLLLHPARGGVGLNLQAGGHTLIFFSLLWSLEKYSQTIGRIYRLGQEKGVVILHIVTKGTIEDKVTRTLNSNAKTQSEFLAALAS